MSAALLLVLVAQAQDYSFPTSAEDYGNFYVTAYYDHHGVDWACGGYQYSGHRGNDYGVGSWTGMDAGRDLVAAADGSVIYSNDGEYDRCDTGNCEGGSGFGNYVKLQHADGRYTYYAHMKQWSVTVSAGDWVACGTKLGEVGSSGYSTGPHLHFEVRESSGSQSDPFDGDCSFPPSYWVNQGSYMGVPGRACESGEPCEQAATLRCGDRIDASNHGAGSTDSHAYYGCSEWTYTGPELVYGFSTGLSERVSMSLSGHSADLDIYVLGSTACDGSDCVAYSDNSETEAESLSFDATAGHSYTVVVDGWEDAQSDFHLEVDCEGGEDPGDSEPPDPQDSEEPEPEDSEEPDRPPQGDFPPGARAGWGEADGCGCGSGRGGGGLGLLGLLGLVGLRRRRG
jgi:MYXO-CTERM domain-containing protein